DTCFVGSSLGGFYATHLVEKRGGRAVLINPAIDPHVGLRAYLGPQKNLHTGEPYELTEAHLREWQAPHCARATTPRPPPPAAAGGGCCWWRRGTKCSTTAARSRATPAPSRSWCRAETTACNASPRCCRAS